MGILDMWASTKATAQASAQAARSSAKNTSADDGSTDPTLVSSNRKYLVQITQDQDIATIGTQGQPVIVIGQVPEDLQMNQSVAWKAPWGAGLAGDGTISDLLAVSTGTRLLTQIQTMQVWQGSGNDVDFTVTFEFRAWSDVDRDVMNPLRKLSSMALPSVDSMGFLRSPGPILDATAAKQIGQNAVTLIQNTIDNATKAVGSTSDGSIVSKSAAAFSAAASTVGQSIGDSKAALEALLKNKIEVRIGDWFRMPNCIIRDVQHTMHAQRPGPNGGLMSATAAVTFSPLFALTTDDLQNLLMSAGARLQSSQKATNAFNGVTRQ